METPGTRIHHLRKEILKVTQEIMGKYAGGISKAAVSSWERDQSKPDRDALQGLKKSKGINPDWVTDGKEPIFLQAGFSGDVQEETELYRPSELAMEIAWMIDKLPKPAQDSLLTFLRNLAPSQSTTVDLDGHQNDELSATRSQRPSNKEVG